MPSSPPAQRRGHDPRVCRSSTRSGIPDRNGVPVTTELPADGPRTLAGPVGQPSFSQRLTERDGHEKGNDRNKRPGRYRKPVDGDRYLSGCLADPHSPQPQLARDADDQPPPTIGDAHQAPWMRHHFPCPDLRVRQHGQRLGVRRQPGLQQHFTPAGHSPVPGPVLPAMTPGIEVMTTMPGAGNPSSALSLLDPAIAARLKPMDGVPRTDPLRVSLARVCGCWLACRDGPPRAGWRRDAGPLPVRSGTGPAGRLAG
jgi:hypothetical protein